MSQKEKEEKEREEKIIVERIQTGVRMEKKLVKVLKALAEHQDCSLGVLLESIVLHSFEGRPAFTEEAMEAIVKLKEVYEMDYDRHDYLRFLEQNSSKKTNLKKS